MDNGAEPSYPPPDGRSFYGFPYLSDYRYRAEAVSESKRLKVSLDPNRPFTAIQQEGRHLLNPAASAVDISDTIMLSETVSATGFDTYQAYLRPLTLSLDDVMESALDTLTRHCIPIIESTPRSSFTFTVPKGQETPLTSTYWQSVLDLHILDASTGEFKHALPPTPEEKAALTTGADKEDQSFFGLGSAEIQKRATTAQDIWGTTLATQRSDAEKVMKSWTDKEDQSPFGVGTAEPKKSVPVTQDIWGNPLITQKSEAQKKAMRDWAERKAKAPFSMVDVHTKEMGNKADLEEELDDLMAWKRGELAEPEAERKKAGLEMTTGDMRAVWREEKSEMEMEMAGVEKSGGVKNAAEVMHTAATEDEDLDVLALKSIENLKMQESCRGRVDGDGDA